MMEFLAANWYWIGPVLGMLAAPLLAKFNIKIPFLTPKGPDGVIPAPVFPTTFGHGELIAYILAVVEKGIADGTIKLPISIPVVPVPNAVSLTPEQVMQLLAAKPPEKPSDAP